MFGSLGAPELIFILGLALLIFGPSKLPELGRTMGKAMAEFRKAANDFKRTLNAEAIEKEMREADPRRAVNDTLARAKKELDSVMHANEPAPEEASGETSEEASEPSEPADEAKAEDLPNEVGSEPADEEDSGLKAAGTVARGFGPHNGSTP